MPATCKVKLHNANGSMPILEAFISFLGIYTYLFILSYDKLVHSHRCIRVVVKGPPGVGVMSTNLERISE